MPSLPSPAQLAAELAAAAEKCAPIEPFSKKYAPFTGADAAAIRQAWFDLQVSRGRRVAGKKLGAVHRRWDGHAQTLACGWGYILDSNLLLDGTSLPAAHLIQPRVEAEFALLLGRDLSGPGVSVPQALAAIAGVTAAFEVVDSRFRPAAPTPEDQAADNGGHGYAVIAPRLVSPLDLDLAAIGVGLAINGEVKGSATGANIAGSPVHALVALANQTPLEAGMIVLTGSVAGAFPIKQGDQVRAEFDRLGAVTLAVE
jgi:2-keto-4-pentenoate hydratase